MRWLHRIGYVTTAIVLVEIVALAVLLVPEWQKHRTAAAAAREETRTHARLLSVGKREGDVLGMERLALVDRIPPAPAGGFRFVATPSRTDRSFAYQLTLHSGASQAQGELVIFAEPEAKYDATKPAYRRSFSISAISAGRFVSRMRQMVEHWPGEDVFCYDAAGVSFELRDGSTILSGSGSTCGGHYSELTVAALQLVAPLVRSGDRIVGATFAWNFAANAR